MAQKHLDALVKRDLISPQMVPVFSRKHTGKFFSLPNEIFFLDLGHGAITVYAYLLYREDRSSHQCHPSYNTASTAVGLAVNTVMKHIIKLVNRQFTLDPGIDPDTLKEPSFEYDGFLYTLVLAGGLLFWLLRKRKNVCIYIPGEKEHDYTLSTGTYSARLTYRILYKTNYSSNYQVLASNLLTSNNYSSSLNAIPMQAGEFVTDIYFDFGKVPVGFQSVTGPTLSLMVNGTAVNGYQMVNRADVGGKYQGIWQTAQASWVPIIRKIGTTATLPKTGY